MAYNTRNHKKFVAHVLSVYREVKEYDIPDTQIVRHIFPKHHIYISYRQWSNIKAQYLGDGKVAKPLPLFKDSDLHR